MQKEMYPNESGRDKETETKNDRFSVNPKSPVWLRSLACVSCPLATLNVPLYPRSRLWSWVVPGHCLCQVPNGHWKHQEHVPEPGSLTAALLRSGLRGFSFTFGSLPIVYLEDVLQNGPGIGEDRGKAQAGFVTIEDYLLLLHTFLICLQVCFPACTPQKFFGKNQQKSVI